jgi:prepilin-type N-terminal cleavage/methylation domain-containing protein
VTQRGFTLIEVLVAMLVFVTGVTGLLALLVTALALHRDGLNLARATRDLDALRAEVCAEVAAGGHRDAAREAFVDVTAAEFPGGLRYSVHFLAGDGVQPDRAELRLGASEAELRTAPPVVFVLPAGPPLGEAVGRWRARIVRPDH